MGFERYVTGPVSELAFLRRKVAKHIGDINSFRILKLGTGCGLPGTSCLKYDYAHWNCYCGCFPANHTEVDRLESKTGPTRLVTRHSYTRAVLTALQTNKLIYVDGPRHNLTPFYY
jgi:hypothetical protein